MDKIKHCITLDMHAATAQTALSVKKGDTARKLIISLYADGKPYRPAEGCTAVLTAKKPDGNILYNACTISDGKIASTTVPDGMYYEITYNGAKNEAYFDAYKKWENKCIKIEEEK